MAISLYSQVNALERYEKKFGFENRPWISQTGLTRTSQTKSRFEGRFFYGLNTDFWQPAKSINGSRTYNSVENGVLLTIGGAAGDSYVDITKQIFFYQPDTVTHVASALVLGAAPGVRRFWGCAAWRNGQVSDGFILRSEGTQVQFVKISSSSGSPVEEVHAQSSWTDPMDGTGPSGIVMDFNSTQMFEINFSWYGGGTAFLSCRINGRTHILDSFGGANRGVKTAIIANPNLSVLYGLEAISTLPEPVSVQHWGLSVAVDGADEETGKPFGVSSSPKVVAGGAWLPVASIRLKSQFGINGATPKPNLYGYITKLLISIYSRGRDAEVAIVRDPTLSGASWSNIPDVTGAGISDSMVEYDISSTAFLSGILAYPKTVTDGNNLEIDILKQDVISVDSLNTARPILSIAARPTSGGNATIAAAFSWREVY